VDQDDPGHIKIGRKLVVVVPKSPTLWCTIYTEISTNKDRTLIVDSKCRSLFKDGTKLTREVQVDVTSLPAWTFRFEATVHAASREEP
jgi:hypothetical protein